MTSSLARPKFLWRNDGGMERVSPSDTNGTVSASVANTSGITSTMQGRGVLYFDYDGNGFQDLMMFNTYGHHHLYKNHGGNGNSWIRARVVHKAGNGVAGVADSYGARVTMRCNAGDGADVDDAGDSSMLPQTKEIGASTHYLGQSERIAHFGVGSDGKCPSATITALWPGWGNAVVVVSNVVPGTKLILVRPDDRGARVAAHGTGGNSSSSLFDCGTVAFGGSANDTAQQHEQLEQLQRSDAGGTVSFPDWQGGRTALYTIPSLHSRSGATASESLLLADSFDLAVGFKGRQDAGKDASGLYKVTITFPSPPPPPPPPPSSVPPTSSLKEFQPGNRNDGGGADGVDGDDGDTGDDDGDSSKGSNRPRFGIGAGKAMPRLCPRTGYADSHSVPSGACHSAKGKDAEVPSGGCPFAQHMSEHKSGSFRPSARHVSNALLQASKDPVFDPRGLNALHYHFGR